MTKGKKKNSVNKNTTVNKKKKTTEIFDVEEKEIIEDSKFDFDELDKKEDVSIKKEKKNYTPSHAEDTFINSIEEFNEDESLTAEIEIPDVSEKENTKEDTEELFTIGDEEAEGDDMAKKKKKGLKAKLAMLFSKKKKNIKINKNKKIHNISDSSSKKNIKKKDVKKKIIINDSNKKPKEKKKKRSFWKKLLTFFLILCIIGVLSVAAFFAYIVITAPEFDDSALVTKEQTILYDMDGAVIAKLGAEKRENISYEDMPQVLIDAIIATEDSRFFQHNGVDLLRFIKATVQQLLGQDEAGGASTLTMQVVKNNVTKKHKEETNPIKKVIRKFQDVYLSVFKVEKSYTKEEILEIYVNDNYLGGAYGVEEASKYYFNKGAADLTLPEAAMIAGLFQSPGLTNPYYNLERAEKRRALVLRLMYNHGYITKEEMDVANSITVESLLSSGNSDDSEFQGFIDTVAEEIKKKTGEDIYSVPMLVYTTMDRKMQTGISAVMNDDDAWYWKDENATAGIAIVNAETGEIPAVGTGRHKTGAKQFNTATGALRQPGSTAKPLFDYGPGIEYNNFSSYQMFNDEPWTYTSGPSVGNWNGTFDGLMTARYALQYSRNVPALKAFQQVGATNSQKFVHSLGLDVALNESSDNYRILPTGIDNTINEAYAIGGVAEGFSPLMMASAYSCFANGGYYIEPHSVTKIEYRESGEVKEFKYSKERVMKDSTAYIINNILESAVNVGFNGGAKVYGSHVAAKTGTSNFDEATIRARKLPSYAMNDLWTVAYTSQYAIGVWYGYENIDKGYNTNNAYKDGLVSAAIKYIPKDTRGWSMPSSVVAVTVEKETWPAKLPSENTPSDMRLTEYFVRGTQPTEVSERYATLANVTNVTQTKNANSVTLTWNFTTPTVITDSYIQSYFNNSLYGNQKQKYMDARKKYNADVLGEYGFGIYQITQDAEGKEVQKLLEFTTTPSYTYKGYGNVTLLIKAEYKNFKNNASTGVKAQLNLGEMPTTLEVALNGNNKITTTVGTYKDPGIQSITYGGLDVSTMSKITYQIKGNTNIFNSNNALDNYVNTLSGGTYTILYNVKYLTNTVTKERIVTLTPKESTDPPSTSTEPTTP